MNNPSLQYCIAEIIKSNIILTLRLPPPYRHNINVVIVIS